MEGEYKDSVWMSSDGYEGRVIGTSGGNWSFVIVDFPDYLAPNEELVVETGGQYPTEADAFNAMSKFDGGKKWVKMGLWDYLAKNTR